MVDLTHPMFQNADLAREWLEACRWPNGPVCPHCSNDEQAAITSLKGKAHRRGLYKCNQCREQFTVTVDSVMERSKIPLNKWALAFLLMAASKKGMSAHQLHRTMAIPYKTAWFLAHRVREAMRDGWRARSPIGGSGKVVEADETYFGKQEHPQPSKNRRGLPYIHKGGGPAGKRAVLALVERRGETRMFHMEVADKATVTRLVRKNIARESRLHTDESLLYKGSSAHFATHETVRHSAGEYVRDDVHSNTVENVFSVFKRGMKGVYQHCAEKHLHRYLAEFEFRHNTRTALGWTDTQRAQHAVRGAAGKRLMYERPAETDIPF
jgi:transposase-like protein